MVTIVLLCLVFALGIALAVCIALLESKKRALKLINKNLKELETYVDNLSTELERRISDKAEVRTGDRNADLATMLEKLQLYARANAESATEDSPARPR